MRRIDLRGRGITNGGGGAALPANSKNESFFTALAEEIKRATPGEVLVILFEIGDFSAVEASFDFVAKNGCELLNSLKFNQVDWTIVIKKNETTEKALRRSGGARGGEAPPENSSSSLFLNNETGAGGEQ